MTCRVRCSSAARCRKMVVMLECQVPAGHARSSLRRPARRLASPGLVVACQARTNNSLRLSGLQNPCWPALACGNKLAVWHADGTPSEKDIMTGPPGTAGQRSACSPTPSSPPAAAWQRAADASTATLKLIPVPVPEPLRQLRGTSFPSPAAISPTAMPGRCGAAATSTALSKPISDGTPTPTRRHGNDLQLPYTSTVSGTRAVRYRHRAPARDPPWPAGFSLGRCCRRNHHCTIMTCLLTSILVLSTFSEISAPNLLVKRA